MDPLAAFISLLRPRAVGSKIISGAGSWAVRYGQVGSAGFGLVLKGVCHLAAGGAAPLRLAEGDFVLMPPTAGFVMYSDADAAPVLIDPDATAGCAELRHGGGEGKPDFKMLGGYFLFDPANADILAGLLPALIHIGGAEVAAKRLGAMMAALSEEALSERPGRDLILDRLVEVMLVEALRFRAEGAGAMNRAGLLAGMADSYVAKALRCIHNDVARRWTVVDLAREAGLSRSAFSDRFTEKVGMAPIEYLIQWRMAVAKDMLQHRPAPLEKVAAAIGYESASAFSTAFRRQVGRAPSHFARRSGEAAAAG